MREWLVGLLVVAACGGDSGGVPGPTVDAPAASVDAPGPTNQSAHDVCITETNRYRAMNGKAALAKSAQLEAYADTGAMIDFNGSPHQHFSSTNGGGIANAENECPKWSLQQQGGGDMNTLVKACIAAFYSEGPGTDYNTHGHYINMMGAYTKLGCGIYMSGGLVTIVQDYGN